MKPGRIVAVDHGSRRTGTAISDSTRTFAFPGEVFRSEEALLGYLRSLGDDLAAVVVGLPLNMDGTVGPRARDVLEFCDRLKKAVDVEVLTWDERLSSFEAEELLKGAGPKGREMVDSVAAQRILVSFLASLADSKG